jgi:hypothetical protein
MPRAPKPVFVLMVVGAPFLLLAVVTCGPLGRPGLSQPDRTAPPPPVPFEFSFQPIHDLASLAPADAAALAGVRRRWRVTMAGPPDRQGVWDMYEVLPENDPQGLMYLEAGPEVRGFVVVDATLEVIHHPRIAGRLVKVAAFTEYRLVDAVRA